VQIDRSRSRRNHTLHDTHQTGKIIACKRNSVRHPPSDGDDYSLRTGQLLRGEVFLAAYSPCVYFAVLSSCLLTGAENVVNECLLPSVKIYRVRIRIACSYHPKNSLSCYGVGTEGDDDDDDDCYKPSSRLSFWPQICTSPLFQLPPTQG
jgi:hypothetical protein